jgi:hypothetical protein
MNRWFFLLLLTPTLSLTSIEKMFGSWESLYIQGKIMHSAFLYSAEGSFRSTESVKTDTEPTGKSYGIRTLLGRAALGYETSKNTNVFVGYLYQWSEPPYATRSLHENRGWQQFLARKVFKNEHSLILRTRLEERVSNIGAVMGIRFREQFKYNFVLTKSYSLIFSEELFMNLNSTDWGPMKGVDQNRIFFGVGYKWNRIFRMELGYLCQHLYREDAANRLINVFSLSLFVDHD